MTCCKNLSPFLELALPAGLLIYTGDYASRGVAVDQHPYEAKTSAP